MIFLINKKEKEKINNLISTRYYNDEVADYINENILNNNASEEDKKEYKIEELNVDDYIKDEYFKKIKIEEFRNNEYQLKFEKYNKNECFQFDDIDVDEDDYYIIKNKIGYFTKEYKYLTVQKNDVIWMSVIPHEINTMKKCLNINSKHIYVFGLGLGYYLSLLALKVDKITVIEKDQNIIDLFNKHIIDKLNIINKVEIIHADAFEYIKTIKDNDAIFVDLYHDSKDGLEIYYKLKQILKDKEAIFWIEKTLLASFRNLFISLIEEELYHQGEFDYKTTNNFYDEIINRLHHYYKEKKINGYSDIKELLSDNNLKKIIAYI